MIQASNCCVQAGVTPKHVKGEEGEEGEESCDGFRRGLDWPTGWQTANFGSNCRNGEHLQNEYGKHMHELTARLKHGFS